MIDTTPSIRLLIIRRLLAVLDTLRTEQGVRSVSRKSDILQHEPALPAVHLVDGDEVTTPEGLDNQGYTMRFPITVKCMTADRDPYEESELMAARVQELIEAEPLLDQSDTGSPLATWVRYIGTEFFTTEVGKPRGGCLVHYEVEYRRKQATPTETY